jgi:23S rRNA (cytidine1920-2'-O)/16S rRNA (cytidine1409-2'-O)-methyltransferase
MIGGQADDIGMGGSVDDLERLLVAAPAEDGRAHPGAVRAVRSRRGASEDALAALTAYGEAVGLAFQLADDALDAESDAGTDGPPSFVRLIGRDATLERARALATRPSSGCAASSVASRSRRWRGSRRAAPLSARGSTSAWSSSGSRPSRERAQSLIRAGQVLVDERVVDKPGTRSRRTRRLRVRGEDHPFVSRGGVKLASASQHFALSVEGACAPTSGPAPAGLPIVCSRTAPPKVYAIDVGYGQLAWKIRTDPRWWSWSGRTCGTSRACPSRSISSLRICRSFLSPRSSAAMVRIAVAGARGILLVKPQFEVGPDRVSRGGVVRDAGDREAALKATSDELERHAIRVLGHVESPILGAKSGNREFLLQGRVRLTNLNRHKGPRWQNV